MENLEILPFDAHSLRQVLHDNGVNVSYLGWIAMNMPYSFLKNLCIVEMVARAAKKILKQKMSEILFNVDESLNNNNNNINNNTEEIQNRSSQGNANSISTLNSVNNNNNTAASSSNNNNNNISNIN